MGFEIRNSVQANRNSANDKNPKSPASSNDKESGIKYLESVISNATCNPESKTVSGYFTLIYLLPESHNCID